MTDDEALDNGMVKEYWPVCLINISFTLTMQAKKEEGTKYKDTHR